jgi:PAS domain S-box-containing protein
MAIRILVVEDSPTQAEALRALLADVGYDVEVATAGAEGLARLEASEFDVVISDIVMPGEVDGYELCRRIKAGSRRSTPVVLLTSLADPLDIIRGLECGADNFFTKGIEPAHLLERLKLLLTTRETRAQSRLRMGVKVFFMNREFTITSEREQILDLLISTFEDAVHQNRELRQREAELNAAKETLGQYAGTLAARLQLVVASTTAVFYTMEVSGDRVMPTWISDSITPLMGYGVREALASDWWDDRLHPEERSSVRDRISLLLDQGHLDIEYRFRHKDGTYRWLHDQSRLVRHGPGQPDEIVGVWVDITTQRQLEDQLRQAQKMEAVGRLAGGIAHDFNNLLTVITNYCHFLLEDLGPDDPRRPDVAEISRAAHSAAALTSQLLAFSRQQVLAPRILNLNDVIVNGERLLKRLLGEDIGVVTALQPALGTIRADPGQLEQVIMNLAVNARDAMPDGGKLTIETANIELDDAYILDHPLARPGPYVMLAVTDTGVGMDEQTQARIFEPFFTTKEMGKGTGLGLATVYGIVKQSGGFIWVYSEPGHGTTFKVYLPRVEELQEPLATPGPPRVMGGVETILLAEDADAVRAVARQVLARLGYTVLEASDGMSALRLAETHRGPIHLLLTDVVMPEIGGRMLAEQLRGQRPGLKVLYSSGYTADAVVRHGMLGPGIAFLQKPFTPEVLARKVRDVLDSPLGPKPAESG